MVEKRKYFSKLVTGHSLKMLHLYFQFVTSQIVQRSISSFVVYSIQKLHSSKREIPSPCAFCGSSSKG